MWLRMRTHFQTLETKYRDIADGNPDDGRRASLWPSSMLETKYRDIADGNASDGSAAWPSTVGNQVPRYSGWKRVDRDS